MNYEYATAAGGPALRNAVTEWGERAVDLGCETRGYVEVEPGLWAVRRGTATELLHRMPTEAETRAALGRAAPAASISPSVARPSAATKRMTKLFGDAR